MKLCRIVFFILVIQEMSVLKVIFSLNIYLYPLIIYRMLVRAENEHENTI